MKNIQKIVIALALTLFLGPGLGHLYLRKYKKGVFLILTSVICALAFAFRVGMAVTPAQIKTMDPAQIVQDFLASNRNAVIIFDAFFAALWAFALVDAYFVAKNQARIPDDPDHDAP